MDKTLKITEEAHQALLKLGTKGETFSDVILRIVKEVEKCNMNNTEKSD